MVLFFKADRVENHWIMSKTGVSGLGTEVALMLSGAVPAQWFSNVFHRVLGFGKGISEL